MPSTPRKATPLAKEEPPEATEPAAPEHPMAEVEITVAGHTVTVKAHAPMPDVAEQALALYRKTKLAAKKIPFGFDSTASQVETVPASEYGGNLDSWEGDDARLGRVEPESQPSV